MVRIGKLVYFCFGIILFNELSDCVFCCKTRFCSLKNNLSSSVNRSGFHSVAMLFVIALVPLIFCTAFPEFDIFLGVAKKKSANFTVCLYAKKTTNQVAQVLLSLTKEQAKYAI